jgi:hypothetical protein
MSFILKALHKAKMFNYWKVGEMQKSDSKAMYPKFWLESAVVAALIGAAISAVISWMVNRSEISAKYVEMAVGILSSEKKSEDPSVNNQIKALRTWAIYVINKYATDDDLKIGTDLGRALTNGDINFNGFGITISPKPAALTLTGAIPNIKADRAHTQKDIPVEVNNKKSGSVIVNPPPAELKLGP